MEMAVMTDLNSIKEKIINYLRDQEQRVLFEDISNHINSEDDFDTKEYIDFIVKWALEDLEKLELILKQTSKDQNINQEIFFINLEKEIIRLSKIPFFRILSDSEAFFIKKNKAEAIIQINKTIKEYNDTNEKSYSRNLHRNMLERLLKNLEVGKNLNEVCYKNP
jgi:hypothetical protein